MTDAKSMLAQINNEVEMLARRIRENTSLIEQSRLEVSRLQQRQVQLDSQLQRVKESLDTLPRQDIRIAYEEAGESNRRLLTMRAQLERLQEGQAQLEHYHDLLKNLAEVLTEANLSMGGAGGQAQRQTMGLAGETIVRIVQAQEQERRELANSLHDGPAQSLTNFILQAEICQRLAQIDPARANEELTHLKDAASSTFQKIRDFIFDLRPMMLDDLGLIPTLRRYCENYANKHNVTVDMKTTVEENLRLPRYSEVMMFRGVQSLLTISTQALRARQISVVINADNFEVRGTVEADGEGFNPAVELDHSHGDSDLQALNALRERVELVEGTLRIFSAEGESSRFDIVLPLFEQEPDLGLH
jgi:two-component system sensor histidine kinase DegS